MDPDDEDNRDDTLALIADETADVDERQGLWDGFMATRTEQYVHARLHRKN